EGRHLFQTERDAPMTPAGFRKTLARVGEASRLAFPVHPHMLRHACGFKLANNGQDTRALQHYLGPGTFSTRSGTRSWPRIASTASGRIERPRRDARGRGRSAT